MKSGTQARAVILNEVPVGKVVCRNVAEGPRRVMVTHAHKHPPPPFILHVGLHPLESYPERTLRIE
jgi:hypothetical protein